jgi:hypothetical protein
MITFTLFDGRRLAVISTLSVQAVVDPPKYDPEVRPEFPHNSSIIIGGREYSLRDSYDEVVRALNPK